MGSSIRCFLVLETGRVSVRLRRFGMHTVGNDHYCDASRSLYERAAAVDEEGHLELLKQPPHDSPSWPTHCDTCGRAFTEADKWQIRQDKIYAAAENSKSFAPEPGRWTQDEFPVGTMYYPSWLQGSKGDYAFAAPDGTVLSVITPGGEWVIDSVASNGPPKAAGWTRTGEPPNVTARPSILISPSKGSYHGFLTDGFLVEC